MMKEFLKLNNKTIISFNKVDDYYVRPFFYENTNLL